MLVFVTLTNGRRIPVEVEQAESVAMLKSKLSGICGMPARRQSLSLRGCVLADDAAPLAEHCISSGMELRLCPPLRGGNMGDLLASLLLLLIVFIAVCASIGWYARRHG
eukprot:RCo029146